MLLAAGNPFISAYVQSDGFGKAIFWGLFLLSALSWILLVHKTWLYAQVRKLSLQFANTFTEKDPLNFPFSPPKGRLLEVPHPYFEMYKTLKQKTLQLISRNHLFAPNAQTVLSDADLGLIDSAVQATLSKQHKLLEKNLFMLSTIATLGPFLGLLGTVWGILLTFSQLHSRGISASNAAMLSGLSMALATTVVGLLIAIPAFAGYNYLKNATREYRRDMEDFSALILASIELQYRRPDHAQTVSVPT